MKAIIVSLGVAVAAMPLCPRRAYAQKTDFATCPQTLPACDASAGVTDCCRRTFSVASSSSERAIVIPLDRCHEVIDNGKLGPPTSSAPAWCEDPSPAVDNGMYEAYGLVYRLMQHGIPVYWAVNPTKDPTANTTSGDNYIDSDIDLWVVGPGASPPKSSQALTTCTGGSCTPAVSRLDPATLQPISGSYDASAFPVRGGAFIIAPQDRAAFDAFWTKSGAFSGLAGNSDYDFSDVDLYELSDGASMVYQNFTTSSHSKITGAPVATLLDRTPPRLARESPAGVSRLWMKLAKLDEPAQAPLCLTGKYVPSDAVYCDITDTQIQQGGLANGNFEWAWIDNWSDPTPCSTNAEVDQMQQFDSFLTAVPGVRPYPGNVMMMEAAVGVAEGCTDYEFMGKKGVGLAVDQQTPTEPLILRYPNNLLTQFGDIPPRFASGDGADWNYYGNGALGYRTSSTTLMRLVTEDQSAAGNALCTGHKSTSSCDVYANSSDADIVDVASYMRYQDNPGNGLVFYIGGNQVTNRPAELRMVLDAFLSAPSPGKTSGGTPIEVSRSSPIVATVGGLEAQYQGTYEVADPPVPLTTYAGARSDSTFQFPYQLGHLRAIDTSTLGTSSTQFTNVSALYDAAEGIPKPAPSGCSTYFSGSCRTVFTNITTGSRPERVFMDTANVASLGPLMAPNLTTAEQKTLISRVLAGRSDGSGGWEPKLGGVDRSTPAVIGASPLIGSVRPTMIYFGANDGMLHAVCADTTSPCTAKGEELWAFMPRTELPLVRQNLQRIEGSPKVADVFGDFSGNGHFQFRTVLTFETGSGLPGFQGQTPAVYALDVTDPSKPQILWEYTTPASRGASELGVGLTTAMGPVHIGSDIKPMTFVETSNGGVGGPGVYVAALDTVSGKVDWTFSHTYPSPRDKNDPDAPSTGIPSGVAAVDPGDTGSLTDVIVPDLYGDLWDLDATNGQDRDGTNPLFQFSSDFHPIGAPPTIYRDRSTDRMYALIVSGGYADPIKTSWSPDTVHQYAVSIALDTPPGSTPITDTGTDAGGSRAFVIDLGAGKRGYAQSIVAGNELYIVTDGADVNASNYGTTGLASGLLGRYSLTGGAPITVGVTVPGGAGSVDVKSGVVYSGSGNSASKQDYSATFDSNGKSAELSLTQRSARKLWLQIK